MSPSSVNNLTLDRTYLTKEERAMITPAITSITLKEVVPKEWADFFRVLARNTDNNIT